MTGWQGKCYAEPANEDGKRTFFMNKSNINAAIKDMDEPNKNGAGAPNPSHSSPAMTLAGNRAIPTTVECIPSIVPFSCFGEISAIKARSTPVIIAVYSPYSTKTATITVWLEARAKPKYTHEKTR